MAAFSPCPCAAGTLQTVGAPIWHGTHPADTRPPGLRDYHQSGLRDYYQFSLPEAIRADRPIRPTDPTSRGNSTTESNDGNSKSSLRPVRGSHYLEGLQEGPSTAVMPGSP